ncbi:MAG: signal peptidase I, partial [Gammaproteobacteria bacterium]
GDLIAIKNFVTKYTQDQHFTKKIVGIAGDVVTIEGEYVLVNGIKHVKLKEKTKDHKKLTPMVAQTIPQQYFFVIAEHNDSFDSRYQEFGLVRENYIEGKVYPIW